MDLRQATNMNWSRRNHVGWRWLLPVYGLLVITWCAHCHTIIRSYTNNHAVTRKVTNSSGLVLRYHFETWLASEVPKTSVLIAFLVPKAFNFLPEHRQSWQFLRPQQFQQQHQPLLKLHSSHYSQFSFNDNQLWKSMQPNCRKEWCVRVSHLVTACLVLPCISALHCLSNTFLKFHDLRLPPVPIRTCCPGSMLAPLLFFLVLPLPPQKINTADRTSKRP